MEVSPCGKDSRRPQEKIMSGAPKGGLMSNSGLSLAASIVGRKPPTDKTYVVSTLWRIPTNRFSSRTLQPSNEPVVANPSVPSYFFMEGQATGLGTVYPLLTLSFFSTWFLLFVFDEEEDVIRNGWTPEEEEY